MRTWWFAGILKITPASSCTRENSHTPAADAEYITTAADAVLCCAVFVHLHLCVQVSVARQFKALCGGLSHVVLSVSAREGWRDACTCANIPSPLIERVIGKWFRFLLFPVGGIPHLKLQSGQHYLVPASSRDHKRAISNNWFFENKNQMPDFFEQ